MRKLLIAASLVLLLAATAAAGVRFVPLEEVAAEADYGVIGRVVDKYCAWDDEHRIIWTHYVVDRVELVFGEDVGPRFEMKFAGGTVGEKTMILTQTPELELGLEYVLFAYDDAKKYSAPTVGHYQGLFRIVRDPDSGLAQLVNGQGRLIAADPAGEVITGPYVDFIDTHHIRFASQMREEAGEKEVDPVIRDYAGRRVRPGPPEMAPVEPALTPVDLEQFVEHMIELRARFRADER
ncbi:MAG: hypothetical protein AB1714_29715 [Acidobacteriota bacterium]